MHLLKEKIFGNGGMHGVHLKWEGHATIIRYGGSGGVHICAAKKNHLCWCDAAQCNTWVINTGQCNACDPYN